MSFYFIKMILIKEMMTNLQFENLPPPSFTISASINCFLTLSIKQEYLNTLKIDFFLVISENITNKKIRKNKHYFNRA